MVTLIGMGSGKWEALSAQAQLSRRQRDVIINDQHLLRRYLVEIRRRRNGIAAEIHISGRFHQQTAHLAQHRLAAVRLELHLIQLCAALFRQFFHGQKSGVVPGVLIFQTGIAQPGNDPGQPAVQIPGRPRLDLLE